MFEDSRTDLFVCTVTNGDALTGALPNGAGGFYKTSDNTLEEGALEAGVEYEFRHRNSKGVLKKSQAFTVAQVSNPVYQATVARREQISYVGYNGTAGSIDAVNSTYYSIRLVLDHTFGMLNNSPLMLTIPYKSDASATQSEVAAGLAIAATAVLDRQPYKYVKVERINSGAVDNALGTATGSVVNGGNTIVFSENMTALVTAGTILRLGGLGAGVQPCYIVTGHDNGAAAARIYTLDQKYQGATNAALAANLIESVTEGNWGLKFTGISVTDANFDPITDQPYVVKFTVQLGENFITAAVTNSTTPFLGQGTYQLVSAQEVYTQFQNKGRHISAYPPTSYNKDTVAAETYALFSFEVSESKYVSVTTGINPISKYRIIIAVETGFAEVAEFDAVLASINGSTTIPS